jgi:hypothetical protein
LLRSGQTTLAAIRSDSFNEQTIYRFIRLLDILLIWIFVVIFLDPFFFDIRKFRGDLFSSKSSSFADRLAFAAFVAYLRCRGAGGRDLIGQCRSARPLPGLGCDAV